MIAFQSLLATERDGNDKNIDFVLLNGRPNFSNLNLRYPAQYRSRIKSSLLPEVIISCAFFDFQTPPAGNKSQYEEIDIPVALLSYSDMLDISKVRGQTLTLTENQLFATWRPNPVRVCLRHFPSDLDVASWIFPADLW